MDLGFTTAVYVVALFCSSCRLAGCQVRKAQSAPFGMALLVWGWRSWRPSLALGLAYGS
jgi:hypothetical protein